MWSSGPVGMDRDETIPQRREGPVMTPHMKVGIIGVGVGLILWWLGLLWVALGVVAVAVILPAIAYAMLDSNQKARLRRTSRRKQLGR